MSLINAQNIDEWLFDHLEGNLDAAQSALLQDFLALHPEYAADLSAWKAAFVPVTGAAVPAYAGAEQLVRSGSAAAGGAGGAAGLAGGGSAIFGGMGMWLVGFVLVATGAFAWWQLQPETGVVSSATPILQPAVPAPATPETSTLVPDENPAVSPASDPADLATAEEITPTASDQPTTPQDFAGAQKQPSLKASKAKATTLPPARPSTRGTDPAPGLTPTETPTAPREIPADKPATDPVIPPSSPPTTETATPPTPAVLPPPKTSPPGIADPAPPEKPVVGTTPVDSSQALPIATAEPDSSNRRSRKKKKRRKPVKRVRMVPLQSDVF